MRLRKKAIFTLFLLPGLVLFYVINSKNQKTSTVYYEQDYQFALQKTTKYGSCQLPILEPWHQSGLADLTPDLNPLKNCEKAFELRSWLENGKLKIDNGRLYGETCWYRCVYFKTDSEYTTSEWITYKGKEVATECEVVEVECSQRFKPTYMYLHVQLLKKPSQPSPPSNASNVYVILIDSVSTSHLKRALPKTKLYLEQTSQAVTFEYLNKVGLNSRPVSYAFLMNESPEDLPRNPWGKERKIGKWNELCHVPLNNFSNFIGYQFRNNGYKTFAMDDSGLGNFNSPDCYGFTEAPMDHYIKQYAIRLEGLYGIPSPVLYDNIHYYQCRDGYEPVFETFQKFVKLYKNQPKFSYIWFTHIAHNNLNNLFRTDEKMLQYFKDIERELNNAFVIFLADHGARNHHFRQSFIGEYEDRNPFLMISVPQKLRTNQDLMNNLHVNSKELVTHYDVYATMLELAQKSQEFTPATAFTTTNFTPINIELKGSSLLHPLPSPRDCNTLLIPFQYCLCQHKQQKVRNDKLALQVGQMIVNNMNKALFLSKFKNLCAKLTLDEGYKYKLIQFLDGSRSETAYHIQLRVLPSNGLHEAHFTVCYYRS
ncbi:unnamed protein product [Bursaphelenchus okinawaensis]|uniref:Sulfatase domain-containing protein n=1 Tax=Bursaphelenchus okinawaensis TaxID=465554 RepID=A0A811L7S0_9BILA|nr:unnamed protein product [Bursaphelenchus okinawaensis]CAG9117343.1 unnamed protein product [Bursaphelenchus okinawaensis]